MQMHPDGYALCSSAFICSWGRTAASAGMRCYCPSPSRQPTQLAFALDLGLVELHAHSWTLWHRNHASHRFQRVAEEKLMDLIPLDQIFEDRTYRRRLSGDELRRRGCRVAMGDQ